MARANTAVYGFNGGVISKNALARVDLERVRVSCEQMDNWLPRVIGDMSTRPGTVFLASTKSDAAGRLIQFIYNASSKALIELTSGIMRVWVSDALVTRVSTSTAIANGTFNTDLASWTDDDETGSASTWLAGGYMKLLGSGSSRARRYQLVTVAGGDVGKVHALKVVVTRGPVSIRVGTSSTNHTYMAETTLRTGRHSLSFTPAGNFYVVVSSKDEAERRVDSIQIEAAGVMELVAPWDATDIRTLRYEQSGDVIFCWVNGKKTQRIERHSFTSWSVVDYDANDGPFRTPNLDSSISIAANEIHGDTSIVSSDDLWDSTHVGALWQLTFPGQQAFNYFTAASQYGESIRVTGVAAFSGSSGYAARASQRGFDVVIAGVFVATVTLQRSFGGEGAWEDVAGSTFAAAGTTGFDDAYDNQIIHYRLAIKAGGYTSGTVDARLVYAHGSQVGIVRITEFTDTKNVSVQVLKTLGAANTGTSEWREGAWSGYRGHPASGVIYDGRLWHGMADQLFGSVSDAYESYDQTLEGDAGPIIRSIAVGPVEGLYWLLPLQRLLTGSASQEVSIRSSSFDEPLTPTKFTARRCSSRGSANVGALAVDTTGLFIQRDGRKLYELAYAVEAQDYYSKDLTRLSSKICNAGISAIAVQRQPDTRIWCALGDGTCAVLLYERAENILGWHTLTTDGIVEDVAALPGADEDDVYFIIRRTINAVTKRYVEKLAKESTVVCGTINKAADAHIVWAGGSTTTVTGLSHLEGKQVVVWYNGAAIHDQSNMLTVSGGQVTTASAINAGAVIGLPFSARYKSMKLAFAAGLGTALEQRKRVDHLGLLLNDTAWKGIKLGRDFSNLRALPKMYQGEEIANAAVLTDYDYDMGSFNGGFSTDSRICIEVKAPYSATIQGMVIAQVTNDKDAPVKDAA